MQSSQADTSFQHGVQELVNFLKEERVEKPTIKRCVDHYNYVWIRSKGVDTEKLYKDIGIGNTLSQDINFSIFRGAYEGLNKIFKGGEMLERKISGVVTNRSYLPNEDITREMDLAPFVYIVHRGQVSISRRGRRLTTITTGDIFGQLSGVVPRPVGVTARSENYTDVLEIPIEDFQDIFAQGNEEVSLKSRYDYMKFNKKQKDIPSLNIEYMIKGIRILKFPFILKKPVDIRSCKWYETYLYFMWLWAPNISVYSSVLGLLPTNYSTDVLIFNSLTNVTDVFFLVYYITELFTMELKIVNNEIKCKYIKWNLLRQWSFILNTMSLFVPKLAYLNDRIFSIEDLARCLRFHLLIFFHEHFCKNFQNKFSPIIMKLSIMFNTLHVMACFWTYEVCDDRAAISTFMRNKAQKYAPYYVNDTIDWNQWTLGGYTRGVLYKGCPRKTQSFQTPDGSQKLNVMAKYWYGNYVIGMWYMATLLTKTELDSFSKSVYARMVKIGLSCILEWFRLWISAVAIAFFFTNYNKLYAFEQRILTFKTYFKCNGLSKPLLEKMNTYAKHLWKKQKGRPIPKFARIAPPCLRQDIFSSLYMHHLRTPTLFQVFPEHFLRQLAVRLKRKVVFPGNYIVQEGDIHPILYFIHEGEVEKWWTDAKGESKMASVLTMNDYFGLVPALFPNTHYQFAYYSRTVVDLICLEYHEWQDLLDAYPDINKELYKTAQKFKHDSKRGKSKLEADTAN